MVMILVKKSHIVGKFYTLSNRAFESTTKLRKNKGKPSLAQDLH